MCRQNNIVITPLQGSDCPMGGESNKKIRGYIISMAANLPFTGLLYKNSNSGAKENAKEESKNVLHIHKIHLRNPHDPGGMGSLREPSSKDGRTSNSC